MANAGLFSREGVQKRDGELSLSSQVRDRAGQIAPPSSDDVLITGSFDLRGALSPGSREVVDIHTGNKFWLDAGYSIAYNPGSVQSTRHLGLKIGGSVGRVEGVIGGRSQVQFLHAAISRVGSVGEHPLQTFARMGNEARLKQCCGAYGQKQGDGFSPQTSG